MRCLEYGCRWEVWVRRSMPAQQGQGGGFGETDLWRRRDGVPGSFVCRTKAGAWLALHRMSKRAIQAAVSEELAALIKHINKHRFINRRH